MAEYYGYFNGVEYDEQFVALVNSILVQNGVFGNGLIVSAGSGMTVNAAQGAAIVDGFIYYNDSSMSLTISTANASLPRIDSIMLRWNIPNRTMNLTVVTGTAQSNPSAPAPVRDGTYYDMQIATVYVGAGVASITAANITDTRPNSTVCGITSGYNSVDIDAMMAQYTAQFNEWFEQMKGQLSTDAAGNLQNQIDGINDIINKNGQESGNVPVWNGSEFTAGAPLTSISPPNLLINSDFAINQRGVSLYSSNKYTADRWYNSSANSVEILSNLSPSGIAKNMISISFAANSYNTFSQPMENFSNVLNQNLTLSFWAKATNAGQIRAGIAYSNELISLSTSWQKFTVQLNPTSAQSTWNLNGFYIQSPSNGASSNQVGTVSIAEPQLVYGTYAGQYIPPDPATELVKCQRFYQRLYNTSDNNERAIFPAVVQGSNTWIAQGWCPFKVTMRAIPQMTWHIDPSLDTNGLQQSVNGIDVNKPGFDQYETFVLKYEADAEIYS